MFTAAKHRQTLTERPGPAFTHLGLGWARALQRPNFGGLQAKPLERRDEIDRASPRPMKPCWASPGSGTGRQLGHQRHLTIGWDAIPHRLGCPISATAATTGAGIWAHRTASNRRN